MTNRRSSFDEREEYILKLNERTANLEPRRVIQFREIVRKSYEEGSIVPQTTTIVEDGIVEKHEFRSVGLRGFIKLDEFNARDYYWSPYFSDVGRAIARGEQRYLQQQIREQIGPGTSQISRSEPDFSVLNKNIEYLIRNNLNPDTILAPISKRIYLDFVKFYESNIDWGPPRRLRINDAQLKLFWSHKYAKLHSFSIFNSKAGVWHVLPSLDDRSRVTMAIGESLERKGYVEYWVETLARYEVIDKRAFRRITLTSKAV